MFHCCVPLCKNIARIRFPSSEQDLQRYKAWIKAVNNHMLFNKPREEVVKSYRVCSKHFSTAQYKPPPSDYRSCLKTIAVPDVKLQSANTNEMATAPSHDKNFKDASIVANETVKGLKVSSLYIKNSACENTIVSKQQPFCNNIGNQKVLVSHTKVNQTYRCCVPGCDQGSKVLFLQPFPKELVEPVRYRKWITAIGCKELEMLSSADVYQKYCVCHTHFSEDQMLLLNGKWKCLKYDAVPNRNLPSNNTTNITQATITSPILHQLLLNTGKSEVTPNAKKEKCVICKTMIAQHEGWDIESVTIGSTAITLQEFITKSIFGLNNEEMILDGIFSCPGCYTLCVKLEAYLAKTRILQDVIINRYLQGTEDVANDNEAELDMIDIPANSDEFKENATTNASETISLEQPVVQSCGNKGARTFAVSKKQPKETQAPSAKTQELIAFGLKPRDMKGPFCCEICGKSFGNKTVFKLHLRLHNNLNLFKCTQCEKKFTLKKGLERHMVKHSGVKPHKCPLCSKDFYYASSIKVHYDMVHSGVRKFACKECDKSFVFKQHLTRHMTTHTGLKSFECPICKATFGYRYNMMLHMRKHDNE